MRFSQMLVVVLCGVALAACGGGNRPSKEYSSLADARKAIPTKLTRHGPPPESDWEAETPPPGVTEVKFNSGKLELKGWLALPKTAKDCPALVFAHGGFAFGSSDFDSVYSWISKGWVVFTPVCRAENGCAGDYDMFYGEIDDLIAAGNYVANLPEVNRKKVFVAGHSVGATRAVLAAMLPGPYRAAAGIGAATDVAAWLEGQEELAPFDVHNADEIYVRSPIEHVSSLNIPLILVRGRDEHWNSELIDQFVRVAKERGKDARAIIVPGDHFTALSHGLREVYDAFTKIAQG